MARVYDLQLSDRLSVSVATCQRWRAAGYLAGQPAGSYDQAEIDRFLVNCAHTFGGPSPRWSQIDRGELALITTSQALALFGFRNVAQLNAFCSVECIPYLKFPGTAGSLRYVSQFIEATLARVEPSVSLGFAMRITGYVAPPAFFAGTGLNAVRNPFSSKTQHVFVSEAGLRAYLRQALPTWIDVEDWIDDCEMSGLPLIPMKEAARSLALPHKVALPTLRERRALYISRRVSHGRMGGYVSPLWLWAQFGQERSLSAAEVARIFDVSPKAVLVWHTRGLIKCPVASHVHDANDWYLWRSCWLAYLLDNSIVADKRSIWRFLTYRLESPQPYPLMKVYEVTKALGCSRQSCVALFRRGEIWSVRTPSGGLLTTPGWVRRFRHTA